MTAELSPAEQLALMIKLAATHHFKQFDKGGRPYILHVLKVMHYLKDKDDDLLSSIAVGHDLIEDTLVIEKDLERLGIGRRVIDGINRLTKVKGQSHEEYLTGILQSHDACRVKLADLRHNTDIRRLKGVGEKDLQRMQKYHKMHTQIKDMIQWYDNNTVLYYPHEDSWRRERDNHIYTLLRRFDEN